LCKAGLPGWLAEQHRPQGEVAVSLEKMNGIEEIDEQAMTMTVLAGTPLQTIQQAALEKGLIFPMDLGARGTANIGGNVSTNAGGVQVIRYGMTRALVMGIEVVLADGTIISSLNKMLKNNAGYDLKHLFIGAEGTLGVVTRVVLRLYPKPKSRCTALVAFNDFADSVTLLGKLQSELTGLVSSFEVMWDLYFDNVAPTVKTFTNPFSKKHGAYAIIEITGNHQQNDMALFEEFLSQQLERELLQDVVIAQSDQQADNIWTLRHGIGDFGSSVAIINYDVSIPIGDMDRFTKTLMGKLNADYPHITTLLFGHIGDSNLHVVIGDYNEGEFTALKNIVHELTGEFKGSVSAEHGIGKLKTDYLALSRSAEEIALMKLIRQSLDPNNILNPGRVIALP
jgi:FAD/FMN-containing dehydrogenase